MFRPKNKAERLELRKSFLTGYQCREVKEADCLIATLERGGRFYLRIFDGTAGNPCVDYWYRTAERRQADIDKHIKNRLEHFAYKAERKQAKNAAGKYTIDESKPHFEVGQKYFMNYTNDDPWDHTAIIKVIKRSACFITFVHCYGDREMDQERAKVSVDGNGEYISPGSFYYFQADNRCLTAEEEAEQAAQEETRKAEEAGKQIEREMAELEEIKRVIKENPVSSSDIYTVKIEWIEGINEACDYMDGRTISIKATEKIFTMVDASRVDRGLGYDKWKFQILKRGEISPVWVDRYDMGDDNGGFIAFMKRYKKGRSAEFSEMVNTLEAMAGQQKIISVSFAPWFEKAVKMRDESEREEVADIFAAVELLTDKQIAAAVLEIPNDDQTRTDIARFFLQQLFKRDAEKALKVFKAWRAGAGLSALDDI